MLCRILVLTWSLGLLSPGKLVLPAATVLEDGLELASGSLLAVLHGYRLSRTITANADPTCISLSEMTA